jgi:hypothetical protein
MVLKTMKNQQKKIEHLVVAYLKFLKIYSIQEIKFFLKTKMMANYGHLKLLIVVIIIIMKSWIGITLRFFKLKKIFLIFLKFI